jgi:hypothetical protein
LYSQFAKYLSLLLLLLLVACGGGGSDGPSTNDPVPAASGPGAGQSVLVQGVVQYERVPNNTSTGGLNFSAIQTLPVRGATVELLRGPAVVAATQSSATGSFAFSAAPGGTQLSVRVRAELKQTAGAAQWDVAVRDNTGGNALYALASSTFNSGTGTVQNLTATTGWTGTSYTGLRSAAPFAILDTIYASQQKLLQVSASAIFPPLQVFWSINNNTASGDLALGNLGSSFFRNTSPREMYILGRQDDDTDEFDASVVAHEWGHYYQSAFSRDDSTGGRHGGADDRLDRRIAFSEGWGNGWSGIVLNQARYFDSSGLRQASGFFVNLNTGYINAGGAPKGWFREDSVQYVIWDLNRQIGFAPLHAALTNPGFKTGAALTDIHSFSSAFRSSASATQTAVLNTLLGSESINIISDQFGSNETNNGGQTVTLPYYKQITSLGNPVVLAAGQTVCVTSAAFGSAAGNKLGQFAYVRFSTTSAGNRTISVSANSGAADVDFEIHSGGRRVLLAETGANNFESSSVSLGAGEHVLLVYDFNRVAGNTCMTISIQ